MGYALHCTAHNWAIQILLLNHLKAIDLVFTRLLVILTRMLTGRFMSDHDELKMTRSSGNVFQDLGYHNADEHLLKTKFAMIISSMYKKQSLLP